VFQTGDPDVVAAALACNYAARLTQIGSGEGRFFAAANRVDLDGVTLHYCRYEAPVSIQFPNAGSFRQFFRLSGCGRIAAPRRECALGAAATAILVPGEDFVASYDGGYSHLVVQCSETALARTSELFLGRDVVPTLEAPADAPSDLARMQHVRAVALALTAQFSTPAPPNSILVRRLRETLLACFLVENWPEVADSSGTPSAAGADAVDRLEAYIRDNWDKPMTVEDMAQACNVSMRSVFLAFKRRKGVSPMAYLRGVKLDQARRLLLEGGPQTSVMDVAMRCGFASFGHFARRYEERFGELPSLTLGRRG
jgi:AraC-like DNA-binding protein